jgi:carbamate kinase
VARTSDEPHRALVAIGGNALVLDGEPGSIPRQQERAATFAEQVADLVADDWKVLVTHGNGPQVGFIMRRGRPPAHRSRRTPRPGCAAAEVVVIQPSMVSHHR